MADPRALVAGIERVDAVVRRASVVLAFAGLSLLFLNAVAVVVDVALRAAFSAPIDRLSDVSEVIIFCAAACCLPAATAARVHITIRALDARLSTRARHGLEGTAAALTAVVFGLIAWQVWRYVIEMADNGRRLSQIDIPVAPFWSFVALCLTLNVAIQLFNLLRHVVRAGWAPAEPPVPSDATLL